MEHPVLTAFGLLLGLAALAVLTRLSPQGAGRLRLRKFWLLVAAAMTPALLAALAGWRGSEDAALWVGLCGAAALALGAGAYVVGLFLPVAWLS